ncbi:hypothetical protein [Pseudoalteromonas xiamenensis]
MTENQKNNAKKSKLNNLGLAIAMGAGIGVIFGQFVFGSVGTGLALGAGLGVIVGSLK